MILLLLAAVWVAVGLVLALVVGKGIRLADIIEGNVTDERI